MNITLMKQNAAQRMAQARPEPRRLTFISTAASLGAAMAAALVAQLVNNYQGNAGLSGMGMANVLLTVSQVLQLLVSVLSPFWAMGLVSVLFAVANGSGVETSDLLAGFRRFGPFLRLMVLRSLVIILIAFLMLTPATLVYSLTPWWQQTQTQIAAIGDPVQAAAEMSSTGQDLPLMLIYLGLVLIVYAVVSYRLRLAEYYIVAGWNGAMLAMLVSIRMTRGRVWDLVRLDLSFWWYYLLSGLLVAVCYLDVIAPLVNLRLPWQGNTAYWVCYGVYALGHLALETFARPRVEGASVYFFRSVAYTEG